MAQEIIHIPTSELHLWTENPRDPIDFQATDFDIIKRAIKNDKKWNLPKLIKEMGSYYDFSELPIVVKKNQKYVVYDGNRRVAVLKYLQNPEWAYKIENKLFPANEPKELKELSKVPCNVCDEKTALESIKRKHINKGSWNQLERDYFEYNHEGKEKSLFLKFEEATGLISSNPKLNENIMKNNILTKSKLKDIGFSFDKFGNMDSMYDEETSQKVLEKIAELKNSGKIKSRGENRYDLKKNLEFESEIGQTIQQYNPKKANNIHINKEEAKKNSQKKTKRQNKEKIKLFGGKLILEESITNDLHRDIEDLYHYYKKNKENLSNTFPNLIRMSLRLLLDTAGDEKNLGLNEYIKKYFEIAKKNLDKDERTTLSNNSVFKNEFIKLLHTGAHNYSNSSNIEQTLAISLIMGKMLEETHGK